jgi:predicted negative regulator of RcsB-dependent stress response
VEDLSEKEQLDAIRAWWAENGSYVMGGIVVGIAVIFGWNGWQTSIANTEIAASTLFEEIMEAAELNLVDNAEPPAETLFSEYNDSPYAAQARLALTRLYMDSGRDQDAADVLRPLAEMPPTDELALVGRFRMTQILLYQEKPQKVVDLVEGLPESAFSARFSEALGDAYVMLGRYSEAEAAYMAASNDDPLAPTVDVTILQLKMNDLPAADQIAVEAAETAAAEDEVAEGSADEAGAGAETSADDASEPESE